MVGGTGMLHRPPRRLSPEIDAFAIMLPRPSDAAIATLCEHGVDLDAEANTKEPRLNPHAPSSRAS